MAFPINPIYKKVNSIITGEFCAVRKSLGGNRRLCIPLDPGSTDYQEYLEWAKTNTAEEAD